MASRISWRIYGASCKTWYLVVKLVYVADRRDCMRLLMRVCLSMSESLGSNGRRVRSSWKSALTALIYGISMAVG